MSVQIHLGDCLEIVSRFCDESVDLVYLDPPFFTQKVHKLSSRDRKKEFSFSDKWKSTSQYCEFMDVRLREFRRVLRSTGSLFFHCDNNASHMARLLLEDVFGEEMFRSEIIWHYRRWSNSQRNLLPAHQTIYFYSKSDAYKFNTIYEEYSPSTNVDQILQMRRRDEYGKAVYARDKNGATISSGDKKGVPSSDVWDIPFLNPKAKERVGYPTQKPVLLMEKIIQLATDTGDIVLDPFCGSGTTLVAAQLTSRNCVGIDSSPEAVEIARQRSENPVKTHSNLLEVGRETYRAADEEALSHLKGLDFVPVHRNNGIDAFLRIGLDSGSIPVRVQRPGESLSAAANALHKAAKSKDPRAMILISTEVGLGFDPGPLFPEIIVVDSVANAIAKLIREGEGSSRARAFSASQTFQTSSDTP